MLEKYSYCDNVSTSVVPALDRKKSAKPFPLNSRTFSLRILMNSASREGRGDEGIGGVAGIDS